MPRADSGPSTAGNWKVLRFWWAGWCQAPESEDGDDFAGVYESAGDAGRRDAGGDGSEGLARVWIGGRKTLPSRAADGFWSSEEESVEAWVSALILRKLYGSVGCIEDEEARS